MFLPFEFDNILLSFLASNHKYSPSKIVFVIQINDFQGK